MGPPLLWNLAVVGHDDTVTVLGAGERLLTVLRASGSCRILGLPIASDGHDAQKKWEQVAALPRDLAMKLAPGANFDVDMMTCS